jgi:hypothetical protein
MNFRICLVVFTSFWNFATQSPSRCLRLQRHEMPSVLQGVSSSVFEGKPLPRLLSYCQTTPSSPLFCGPSLLRRSRQPSVVSSFTSRSVASSSPRPSRKSPQQAARLLALRVPQRHFAGSYTIIAASPSRTPCRPACRTQGVVPACATRSCHTLVGGYQLPPYFPVLFSILLDHVF